ncbi:MAG: transposase [Bulleidia sp.]
MEIRPIESEIDDHSFYIYDDDGKVLLQECGGCVVEQLELHKNCIRAITSVYPEYINLKRNQRISAKQKPVLLKDNIVTPSLMTEIYVEKYCNDFTLEQIEQNLKYQKLKLSPDLMAYWLSKVYKEYFVSFTDRLIQEIRKEKTICVENLSLQNQDNRLWTYDFLFRYSTLARKSQKKIVVYDYSRGYAYQHVNRRFEGYTGIILADEPNRIKVESCKVNGDWFEIKARLETPVDSGRNEKPGKTAMKGIRILKDIFNEEEKLNGLPPNRKVQERKKKVAPLVNEFFMYVDKTLKYVPEGVQPHNALYMAKHNEKFLRAFLEDGLMFLDEKEFLGYEKKVFDLEYIPNISFEGTAFYYTFTETALHNHLNPGYYFHYVLDQLIKLHSRGITEIPEELMPWSKSLPDYVQESKQQ